MWSEETLRGSVSDEAFDFLLCFVAYRLHAYHMPSLACSLPNEFFCALRALLIGES